MRRTWQGAGILIALSMVGPAGAGLYDLTQPVAEPGMAKAEIKPLPFSQFRDVLTDLLKAGIDLKPESPLRLQYQKRRDELQAKSLAGLSPEEQINLSACLIRLRQYEEAGKLLTPMATDRRQRDFMVFANLGTAEQYAGQLDRAKEHLLQVKDYWPRERPGWSKERLEFYKQAEKYQLRLLRLRSQEQLRQPAGQRKSPESVDDLFEVQFVGDSGQYEAGKLAAAQQEKLPKDALAIVQQLLIWMPDDTRLYWLLGELYNARGEIAEASTVFEDCVWGRGYAAQELREHRQVVQEARPKAVKEETPASWMPDRQHLLVVGGTTGLILAGLVYLQIREIRRRRQRL